MKKEYEKSEHRKPEYSQEKVDAEIKRIILQKELQGIPLKKVCKLLGRNDKEINIILGRKYKEKIPSYLRKD